MYYIYNQIWLHRALQKLEDTKLEWGPSFTLPVPLANAWPTSVGQNQPSNISQDLCLGAENNFVTSRKAGIRFWGCSFRGRGHLSSNRKYQAWENSPSLFHLQVLSHFYKYMGFDPSKVISYHWGRAQDDLPRCSHSLPASNWAIQLLTDIWLQGSVWSD